jgi:hypothetical protein
MKSAAELAASHGWNNTSDRFPQRFAMSLTELETAVAQLPAGDLAAFAQWFQEYMADAWDRQIEGDILAGKLDKAAAQANADFEAGRCTPL